MSAVLDFTSALYLGLRHPSWSLRPWMELTTGAPAALRKPRRAGALAQRLALLQGCETGTLGPSTLHLFWDLFGMLGRGKVAIYMDACLYPIGQWGIERAAACGAPVRTFAHHDPDALRLLLQGNRSAKFRPVVVADGFCPVCGREAPISAYLQSVREFGGLLVLDDTQALGILGHSPGPRTPYGKGGGGSLRWTNISGPDVLVISSMAKAFGVPVAVLCGNSTLVHWFEDNSETRVHSSPPSFAAIHAAEHALGVNRERGDTLRLRLARRVHHFGRRLEEVGFSATGRLFPVQTLAPIIEVDTVALYQILLRLGIRTVLRRGPNEVGPRITFLITARHSLGEIDRAVDALAHALVAKAVRREVKYEQPIRV